MDKTFEIISFFLENQNRSSFFDILKFIHIVKKQNIKCFNINSKLELFHSISKNNNFSISFCKKRYVKINNSTYYLLNKNDKNKLLKTIEIFNNEPDFKYLNIG